MKIRLLTLVLLLSLAPGRNSEHDPVPDRVPAADEFNPGGTYREGVSSPTSFFGFPLADRPLGYTEILAYFEYLDSCFSNVFLTPYGTTYEGRKLVYLTVTSEENARRLATIREQIQRLADPRSLSGAEAESLISQSPAVAWLQYSIHGDELSSSDAAVQLAYQLAAGTDPETGQIRDALVVCIDPLQNPDGRTRFLGQMQQWGGRIPNDDVQSLQHRGVWPGGRGNHYLFDLNRDWFTLVHPETRARVKALLSWHPQLVVDAHEMGAYDTYLFDPPREPFNPYLPSGIRKWWQRFSADQAAAFDEHGWSYYTREWNEELFPGYGSSWPIYSGLVALLYEQAGVEGSAVKRPDGIRVTYRETVLHQYVSSWSNLKTAARYRTELLRDFYQEKVAVTSDGKRRRAATAYLFPPGANRSRRDAFAATLQAQEIEVMVLPEPLRVKQALHSDGTNREDLTFPAGTLLIPVVQPNRHLVEAILDFDVRLPSRFLKEERKELLKKGDTRIYDATGWSLCLAYGLEAYYSETVPPVEAPRYVPSPAAGSVSAGNPRYGWIISAADDRSIPALGRLLEMNLKVWSARNPFTVEGRSYPRGTLLIRRRANPALTVDELEAVAAATGVEISGVNTALAEAGPDLGGNEFTRLLAPRVALVGGSPVGSTSFGTLWYLLDHELGLKTTLLEAGNLAHTDLRKYNLLVFPAAWGGPEAYRGILGEAGLEKVKNWVRDGGTLIGLGTAMAFLTDTSTAVSGVRQKRQVLDRLARFERVQQSAQEAEAPRIDSLAIWEGTGPAPGTGESAAEQPPGDPETIRAADELARKLRPRGTILNTTLDPEHWLTFGCPDELPVTLNSSYAYLAGEGIEVPVRLAEASRLRLSGLLWPEARRRWSGSAYATREALGHGQVILFADDPYYRAYFHGSKRLLLNALLLGPGFGTSPAVEW